MAAAVAAAAAATTTVAAITGLKIGSTELKVAKCLILFFIFP